jgi:hypothetical protein
MKRALAAWLAVNLLLELPVTAAGAAAPAADPFAPVPIANPERRSHHWAYASLLAGAGLVGLSFAITDRANHVYGEYLSATDPAEVNRLYDETQRDDRWSAVSLLSGEVLFAAGIWLRFLHRPASKRVSLQAEPNRCAISLRF